MKVTPSGNRSRHPFDGLPVISARFTEATSWILTTDGLTKTYGDFHAVDHLDLENCSVRIFLL